MDYFTSDTHFNHKNVIEYCNRPFSSVEEMNEVMTQNWNRRVRKNDTVYVIGDFIMGRRSDSFEIRNNLNGNIVLIRGDHDKIITDGKDHNLEVKLFHTLKRNKIKIALFHWCIRVWPKSHFNSWHLFGHSHGNLKPIGKSWDVGVDNNNFELLSYDEIVDIMDNRPDNPNLVKKGKR